jgi:hypothetical protein
MWLQNKFRALPAFRFIDITLCLMKLLDGLEDYGVILVVVM